MPAFQSVALPAALVFDMDGLLTDTEPFWRKAEIEVFASVGLHLTEADCIKTMGFRFNEVEDYWYALHPWTGKSKEQIEQEVLDRMEAYIRTEGKAMPGAQESLRFCKQKGIPMALASGSSMRLIDAVVDQLNIREYFTHLVSAEHEAFGKPHPGIFIRTASLLGVSHRQIWVLEDSLNGVIAAKAARMFCVAVPDAEHRGDSRFSIADVCLPSLEHLKSLLES